MRNSSSKTRQTVQNLAISVLLTSLTAPAFSRGSPAIQCEAYGHKLRHYNTSSGDFFVSSILQFDLMDSKEAVTIDNILGHLGISAYAPLEDIAAKQVVFNYYGTFFAEQTPETISKRAKKYSSSKYFRFKEFNAEKTTRYDGGGMWGYFVLSKKASARQDKYFDGHYIFQAGDHMGGTVDYRCERRF